MIALYAAAVRRSHRSFHRADAARQCAAPGDAVGSACRAAVANSPWRNIGIADDAMTDAKKTEEPLTGYVGFSAKQWEADIAWAVLEPLICLDYSGCVRAAWSQRPEETQPLCHHR